MVGASVQWFVAHTVSNFLFVLTQRSYYARRIHISEFFFPLVVYNTSPQSNFPPVSKSIICPIIIVSYRSRLTEAPLNVASQVAIVAAGACTCSCYPLGGISIIIFLRIFVALGICEFPALSSLFRP